MILNAHEMLLEPGWAAAPGERGVPVAAQPGPESC